MSYTVQAEAESGALVMQSMLGVSPGVPSPVHSSNVFRPCAPQQYMGDVTRMVKFDNLTLMR